jgi:23S rRNA (guanosine2251-2'-O)-methyltransferase
MPRRRIDRTVGTRRPPRRGGPSPGSLGGERVEGVHAVRELLVAARRDVDEVVVDAAHASSSALEEIAALCTARSIPFKIVPAEEFVRRVATASPQGVLARAHPIIGVRLEDLCAQYGPFLVVLAGVTDPHNLGAILRSALGAGCTGVVLGRHRSAQLTPSALKAAAGAAEHLPIAAVSSIAQALVDLGRRGVWTVGLDAEGESSVFDLEVADRPIALVAGAEGRGLPPLVRRRCDLVCRIPLFGPVESLNVATAVGVAAFAVATRRSLNEIR